MTAAIRARARVHVPEGSFSGDQPLVAVMRGAYVGSLHRGSFAVVTTAGQVHVSLGDPAQPVFLRSAAKPFQVMPAVLAGGIERFGISEEEIAVLCASHSGEPRHTDAVRSVLQKIGLEENALRCGIHPPLHEATANALVRAGKEPTPVCNNCSGAHAGMLVACRANGWPVEGYGSPDHPLQQETFRIIAAFAGVSADQISYGVDNCHVPAFRLPLANAGQSFARLATGIDVTPELQIAARLVRAAMTAYPEMVGGEDRFDTDLMTASNGSVVAKGGAEGFQGIGLTDQGLGIAAKVSDGNARALPPAIMRALDFLSVSTSFEGKSLAKYRHPLTYDREGELVGEIVPVFELTGAE